MAKNEKKPNIGPNENASPNAKRRIPIHATQSGKPQGSHSPAEMPCVFEMSDRIKSLEEEILLLKELLGAGDDKVESLPSEKPGNSGNAGKPK